MGKYNDAVANIYVNIAKDNATKNAEYMSATANAATDAANAKGTKANHLKAEKAHSDAASAWRGLDDVKSNSHAQKAQAHFSRAYL